VRRFNKAFERTIKQFINPPKSQMGFKIRKETARILNISLPTLHLLPRGTFELRIGNRVLYKQEDIENALNVIVHQTKSAQWKLIKMITQLLCFRE
jgi:hypothetical protein